MSTVTEEITDIELIELTSDDGLHCADSHTADYTCSIEVTHIGVIRCGFESMGPICTNSARVGMTYIEGSLAEPGLYVCGGCKKDVADCWEIRPI